LIPLQPKGTKPPLFIAPGVEGKCYYLVELATSLGVDQPVYGFQSVGLLLGEEPLDSIEAMADFYILLMKKIQPIGPYHLAGHSMGGWVVMQMAAQLRKQGESVRFIGLLDSYSPTILESKEGHSIQSKDQELNDLLMLVDRLAAYYKNVINLSEIKENLEFLDSANRFKKVNQWAISNGLVSANFSQEEVKRWTKVIGTNSRISYRPIKTNQETILFKAKKIEPENSEISRCLGWSTVLNSNIRIEQTPGDHTSMLMVPNVAYLAKAISTCLAELGEHQEETISLKNTN